MEMITSTRRNVGTRRTTICIGMILLVLATSVTCPPGENWSYYWQVCYKPGQKMNGESCTFEENRGGFHEQCISEYCAKSGLCSPPLSNGESCILDKNCGSRNCACHQTDCRCCPQGEKWFSWLNGGSCVKVVCDNGCCPIGRSNLEEKGYCVIGEDGIRCSKNEMCKSGHCNPEGRCCPKGQLWSGYYETCYRPRSVQDGMGCNVKYEQGFHELCQSGYCSAMGRCMPTKSPRIETRPWSDHWQRLYVPGSVKEGGSCPYDEYSGFHELCESGYCFEGHCCPSGSDWSDSRGCYYPGRVGQGGECEFDERCASDNCDNYHCCPMGESWTPLGCQSLSLIVPLFLSVVFIIALAMGLIRSNNLGSNVLSIPILNEKIDSWRAERSKKEILDMISTVTEKDTIPPPSIISRKDKLRKRRRKIRDQNTERSPIG